MSGRLLRVIGIVLLAAGGLVTPVVVTATSASADTVIDGCTIVSNPTATNFTNCPNAGFAGANLSGLNLSFANLSGAGFTACFSGSPPSCEAADLSDANLTDANLTGTGLSDFIFEHNPLPQFASAAVVLSGADLAGADLANTGASEVDFSGANLSGADLAGTNFGGADLSNANLTGATLTGASMTTTIQEFDVTLNATLTGANFTGTLLVPPNESVPATSPSGAVASWATPAALPGASPGSCTPPSGSAFPLFASTVTCQVLDANGDVATGTFTLTVAPTTTYFTRVLLPSSGAALSGEQVLDAGASDAPGVTKVQFQLSGGTLQDAVISGATQTIYGWIGQWDTTTVPDGTYTLQSVASDSAGNTSRSLGVTIHVNNHPPTTAVLVPATGASVTGSQYLDASASDAGGVTKVEFHLSGGSVNDRVIATATPTRYGWLASWNSATVPNGSYTLESVAYGPSGVGTPSATTISITVSNPPPATAVLVPSSGATLAGTTTLDASAGAGTTQVQFELTGGTLNDHVVATATPTAYGWLARWDTTTVANGTYTLESVATGPSGVGTSAGLTVVLDNAPPTTAVLVPSSGATLEGTTTLDASAGAGTTQVQFELTGGTLSDQVVSTATPTVYGWLARWDTTTDPNGTYTLTSVASFANGESSTSTGTTVVLDNVPVPTAFVVNSTDDSVTPIPLATKAPGTPIPVDNGPLALAVTPDNRTAYVVNNTSGSVTPINTEDLTAGTAIPVGQNPDAIAVTPNGATAYVVNNGSNSVTPIDTATNTAGTPIAVGAFPDAIAITPDGATAYVVDNNDAVTPIDTATNTAQSPITVGNGADAVTVAPDGTTAYVSNLSDGTVTPIATATNTAGSPIAVGSDPHGIAVTPNGTTAYVCTDGTNAVTPLDVATNTAESPITIGPTGSEPARVVITPDGTTVYVDVSNGSVTPIATATNSPGSPIPVGSNPGPMAVSPDGTAVYVVAGTNSVTPIETATDTAGAAIPVGNNPQAIAIS